MTDYHKAHEAYINAVADSFLAANIAVLFHYADPNDPRDGAIQLDPDSLNTGYDEVWIGWQEERGWHVLAIDKQERGEDHRYVHEFDCYSLCNPSGVVQSVFEYFGVPPGSIRYDDYPELNFPDHSFDDDDPAFEAALAAYRTERAAE